MVKDLILHEQQQRRNVAPPGPMSVFLRHAIQLLSEFLEKLLELFEGPVPQPMHQSPVRQYYVRLELRGAMELDLVVVDRESVARGIESNRYASKCSDRPKDRETK